MNILLSADAAKMLEIADSILVQDHSPYWQTGSLDFRRLRQGRFYARRMLLLLPGTRKWPHPHKEHECKEFSHGNLLFIF
jgi:hypothetical protein